jgi:hypothetical protein
LIADTGNQRVRAVDRSAVITTVARGARVSRQLPAGLSAALGGAFVVTDEDPMKHVG